MNNVLLPETTALVMVDIQNDFLHPDGHHGRNGRDLEPLRNIVPQVLRLQSGVPEAVKKIWVITEREHDGADDYWRFHRIRPVSVGKDKVVLEGDRLAKGTWGARIVEDLCVGSSDTVVSKRRHDAFYQTDLEYLLRIWDIRTLIFTGVATEVCVETTLREAFVRDFDVVLVDDATAGWSREAHEATLNVVRDNFGWVMTTGDVLRACERA